jgi:hypothetical protein
VSIPNLPAGSGFFLAAGTNGQIDAATGLTAACLRLAGTRELTNDLNTNGIPDIWEVMNFGTLLGPNPAPSILESYQDGTDPNPITFALSVTNRYVNTNLVLLPMTILSGIPASMAVLVNNSNFDSAVWVPYTSGTVIATLSTNDGDSEIWVGLRGRLENGDQTWRGVTITLDTVPPVLVITNPLPGAVTWQPVLQLQGYGSEPLAWVSFDLTNAAGVVSNQPGFLTRQQVDTNGFNTNYFQCYDVPLAPGLNSFAVRVADLAGNVSTASLTVTLDTSLAPTMPALTIDWPPNGAVVAGATFTLRGHLDDPTASVWVSESGMDPMSGIVQRDGSFLIANVPLPDALNSLTVAATNIAGAGATLSWSVSRSSVSVALDSPSANDLSQPSVTLTGTISDANYDVWVNGVQATVSGDPTWQASPVPLVNLNGTGQIDIGIYPPGSDPDSTDPLATQSAVVPIPSMVLPSALVAKTFQWNNGGCGQGFNSWLSTENWEAGLGGLSVSSTSGQFGTSRNETVLPAQPSPAPPWWSGSMADATSDHSDASECGPQGFTSRSGLTYSSQTTIELVAGASEQGGFERLIRLTASAWAADGTSLPASSIQILGQALTPTATNANVGEMYVSMPAGATQGLPYSAPGNDFYSIEVGAEDVKVKIIDNQSGVDLTGQTTNVVVGQKVSLRCELSMTNVSVDSYRWQVPGFAISNYVVDANSGIVYSNFSTNSSSTAFYWVDGGSKEVRCTVAVAGKERHPGKAVFNVIRPNIDWIGTITGSVNVGLYGSNGLSVTFGSLTTNALGGTIVKDGIECRSSNPQLNGYEGSYDFFYGPNNPRWRSLCDSNRRISIQHEHDWIG